MKREIDLTERNDFSRDEIISFYNKNRGRRKLPWFRTNDDLAVRTNGLVFTKYNTFDDDFNNFWSISTTNNITGTWNNDIFNTNAFFSDTNSTTTDTFISFAPNGSFRFSYGDTTYYWSNLADTADIESYGPEAFFTGKRDDIKHKLFIRKTRKKSYYETNLCRFCGKSFKWKKNPFTSDKYCSKECEQKHESKNKQENHEHFHKRFKRIKNTFRTISEVNRFTYPIENGDIPNLSSFIKHKKKLRYHDDRIEWRCDKLYEDRELIPISWDDHRLSNLTMVINTKGRPKTHYSILAVYWKNKSKYTLDRREEWWSLTGRRPQPYDKMFEKMNWRDMLRRNMPQQQELRY